MRPECEVIVINWNGRHFLDSCLEALRRQDCPDFTVTVVDNGSSDGSAALLRERFPEVNLLALPQNLGFAAANNRALAEGHTPFVALMNNDAIPETAWLSALLQAASVHCEAGFFASKMVYRDNPAIVDRVGDAYSRVGAGVLRGRGEPAEQYTRPEWVFGACAGAALYRREAFRQVGLFDEDFFILNEDVDWSFRAQLLGFRCFFVPDAVVRHGVSATIREDSPASVYYGHRNLEWVYGKNMPASLLKRTLAAHVLYDGLACLYFLARGRGVSYLRAKVDALRGMPGLREKRRRIQADRRIADRELWDLFQEESFRGRFIRRLRR